MSYRQAPATSRQRRPRSGARIAAGPIAAIVVLAAVVAIGLVVWHPWSGSAGSSDQTGGASPSSAAPKADAAAQAFAQAWSRGDLTTIQFAGGVTPAAVTASYQAITKDLTATSVKVTAEPVQPAAGAVDGEAVVATLHVAWSFGAGQQWKYDSSVELERAGEGWGVQWSPSVIQPDLQAGDTLRYTRTEPKRSTILDGAGQPLVENRPVVDIGVEPSKTSDPAATAAQLSEALAKYGIDADALAARVKAAPPDRFVEVITLRDGDFAPVAAAVSAVPGVVLHHVELQLSPSHDFARALLGTVGPVTKEIVDNSKGRYRAGDVAGLSGLEKEFDTLIGGSPGYEIDIVHASTGGSTPLPTPVAVVKPVDGQPLRTTIDQRVQNAADAALSSVTDQPTALVAIQISSGHVVAVANGPNGGGFDAALLGQVPPGSAFKIVTTTALLQRGLDVNEPVQCPQSIVVQGKSFHNYEGEALGKPPFHTDFAQSCNTAFITLSGQVAGQALPDAARSLGIGACWSLGTPAYRGSVPAPKSPVDLAAAAFGQGSTLVSPVSLALAAATVARGSYVAPQLVLNGPAADCSASGSSGGGGASAAGSAPTPAELPSSVTKTLQELMREVVTSGTATVLAGAPGGPVMAKTGTAEYGGGASPKTHAWLVGYQGDIAFAVYVQDGRSGGTVAGPLALKFLQDLAASAG